MWYRRVGSVVSVGHLTEVAEVVEEEEDWWDLSRPENGWKDRRGGVERPQAAPTTCPHCPILLLLLLRRRSGLPGRERERQRRRRRRRRRDFPHHLLSSRASNPQSQSAVQVRWGQASYTGCCGVRKIIGSMPLGADSCILPAPMAINTCHRTNIWQ